MNAMVQPTIEFPDKLQCLFQPKRYKVLYGGRGGAKSWGIARALLLQGYEKPLRVLCARELQASIGDSVHKLLSDQIEALGLQGFYKIEKATISGVNGTVFSFEGIRHNTNKIKSYEGIDVCWVEEANKVTKSSWDILIPTIRKTGSEIWISFNPELEEDETYKRFVKNPPPNAFVVFMTYEDNPWFGQTEMLSEMEHLRLSDPDAYLNVWMGKCIAVLQGAVYGQELRQAALSGRISKVPYNPALPVETFWDLGWSDMTSIWFRQRVGFEFHYIDFYQNRLQPLNHYLKVLQDKPYLYSDHWLPHDARAHEKGSGMSVEERMRKTHKTRIVKNISLEDGIDAGRTIFSQCWFDENACSDGLHSLRHYQFEIVEQLGTLSRVPKHDWSSHAADAFRYSAVASRQPRSATAPTPDLPHVARARLPQNVNYGAALSSLAWMG